MSDEHKPSGETYDLIWLLRTFATIGEPRSMSSPFPPRFDHNGQPVPSGGRLVTIPCTLVNLDISYYGTTWHIEYDPSTNSSFVISNRDVRSRQFTDDGSFYLNRASVRGSNLIFSFGYLWQSMIADVSLWLGDDGSTYELQYNKECYSSSNERSPSTFQRITSVFPRITGVVIIDNKGICIESGDVRGLERIITDLIYLGYETGETRTFIDESAVRAQIRKEASIAKRVKTRSTDEDDWF